MSSGLVRECVAACVLVLACAWVSVFSGLVRECVVACVPSHYTLTHAHARTKEQPCQPASSSGRRLQAGTGCAVPGKREEVMFALSSCMRPIKKREDNGAVHA
jgi:hypothetical protein